MSPLHRCPPDAAGYARDVGAGVYDVHSPLVPSVDFMVAKIRSFLEVRLE